MATIPTVKELTEKYEASYNARTPAADRMPVDKLHADARATAAVLQGLYQFGNWILKQQMPQTADEEYLYRHGEQIGVIRKSAAKAVGTISVGGNVGAGITAGKKLTFSDGTEYVVTESVTLSGTTQTAKVEAAAAGVAGNRAAGDILTFAEALAGINSTATVIDISGGTEIETAESLLSRLLEKEQEPPQGGDLDDWKQWCLSVSGITQVWVSPHESGVGTVSVRVMADNDTSDGIPTEAILERCRAYLETVRPVTVKRFFVLAPEFQPQALKIKIVPNTPEVRSAVEAELKEFFIRKRQPNGKILLSHLNAVISATSGEEDHKLISPTEDIQAEQNKIITLGEIEWTN